MKFIYIFSITFLLSSCATSSIHKKSFRSRSTASVAHKTCVLNMLFAPVYENKNGKLIKSKAQLLQKNIAYYSCTNDRTLNSINKTQIDLENSEFNFVMLEAISYIEGKEHMKLLNCSTNTKPAIGSFSYEYSASCFFGAH